MLQLGRGLSIDNWNRMNCWVVIVIVIVIVIEDVGPHDGRNSLAFWW
jgi:hypothetical protein